MKSTEIYIKQRFKIIYNMFWDIGIKMERGEIVNFLLLLEMDSLQFYKLVIPVE